MANFSFNVDAAKSSLRTISVTRAMNYLTYIFEAQDDEILVENVATTPTDLALECNPNVRARHLPIRFWGGPPGEEDWFEGSLLTMLIDRLFYNIAAGNISVVRRFQECYLRHA